MKIDNTATEPTEEHGKTSREILIKSLSVIPV